MISDKTRDLKKIEKKEKRRLEKRRKEGKREGKKRRQEEGMAYQEEEREGGRKGRIGGHVTRQSRAERSMTADDANFVVCRKEK